jgi:hypothetical protein
MVMRKVEVVVKIPIDSTGKLEQLLKAEEELRKAGIVFDTGMHLIEKVRHWNFDYSLEGAEVYINDPDKSK